MKRLNVILGWTTIVAGLFYIIRTDRKSRSKSSGQDQSDDDLIHDSLAAHHWFS